MNFAAHRLRRNHVHVLMGQRRTRGAVEAGAITIPVMVVASPKEAERITSQEVKTFSALV